MTKASPADARKSLEVAMLLLKSGIHFIPVVVLSDEQAAEAQHLSESRLNQMLQAAEKAEAAAA
jgi:Protein of unknown function (DUF1382)